MTACTTYHHAWEYSQATGTCSRILPTTRGQRRLRNWQIGERQSIVPRATVKKRQSTHQLMARAAVTVLSSLPRSAPPHSWPSSASAAAQRVLDHRVRELRHRRLSHGAFFWLIRCLPLLCRSAGLRTQMRNASKLRIRRMLTTIVNAVGTGAWGTDLREHTSIYKMRHGRNQQVCTQALGAAPPLVSFQIRCHRSGETLNKNIDVTESTCCSVVFWLLSRSGIAASMKRFAAATSIASVRFAPVNSVSNAAFATFFWYNCSRSCRLMFANVWTQRMRWRAAPIASISWLQS